MGIFVPICTTSIRGTRLIHTTYVVYVYIWRTSISRALSENSKSLELLEGFEAEFMKGLILYEGYVQSQTVPSFGQQGGLSLPY
jgi:hypothetical protein